jgi:uncharacterized protein
MLICLKTCSTNASSQHAVITLTDRLPSQIVADCTLNCDYRVQRFADFHLLTLDVKSALSLLCSRCLEVFTYPYENHTELAVCRDEATATQVMNQYECIVGNQNTLDLVEILTDELHLYAPYMHKETCQLEIK